MHRINEILLLGKSSFKGLITAIIIIISPSASILAAAIGDYRSVATGNWNNIATWQICTVAGSPGTWAAAGATPNNTNGVITIQSPHVVTVSAGVTADEVVINSGGQITVSNAVILTINNGTGTDLTVNGTLDVAGTVTTSTSGATTINGTLTITATGTVSSAQTNTWIFSAGSNTTIASGGNLTINPGGTPASIDIDGNITCSGTITAGRGNAGEMGSINNGAVVTLSGSGQWNIASNGNTSLNVKSGGTIIVGSSAIITGIGDFTLASGANIQIGSAAGITGSGATGSIQNSGGTRTFPTTANYTYNGTVAQVTGAGLPATVNSFTANNNAGVSLTADLIVTTDVIISGGTFNANNRDMTVTGNWTKASGSTFTQGSGTATFNGAADQAINGTETSQAFNNLVVNKPSGTLTTGGSTTTLTANNFTLTAGNFTAPATFTAAGFITLNAGTFTAGNNIAVGDNWTKAAGATFIPGTGTVTFNATGAQGIRGAATSQTFYNVIVLKSGGTLNVTGSTDTFTVNNFTQTSGNFTAPSLMIINVNLTQSSGTFSAGSNIRISGNWSLATGATYTHSSGTVTFNGSSSQNIGGTLSTTFYNVVISNNSGIDLGASITIDNNIDLSGGSLTLSIYSLTLATTASLSNFGATRYIVTNNAPLSGGFLIQYVSGTKIFPVGTSTYTPVTVANSGTADNYRVRGFNGVYTDGTTGGFHTNINNSVNRTWLVEEATAGGSNVTLTLQWNTADENPGFTPSFCGLFHYTVGAWNGPGSFIPANNISADVFSISRSGISSFSPFGVGDGMSPLPVELLSFTAKLNDKVVELKWITATEINNSFFAIERSADGKDFETIDKVEGAGNSNSLISYTYSDISPLSPPGRISYYRLRQVDFNGTSAYSSVEVVKSVSSVSIGNIYPNPTTDSVNIPIEALKQGVCTVSIFDLSGRIVYSEEFNLVLSSQTLIIPTSDLPQGAYIMNLKTNGEAHSIKLIK